MQEQSQESQEQILKELADSFLSYQKGKEGRIIYPPELREKVGAAVEAGMSHFAVASICRISTSAVRNWTKVRKPRSVKRLRLEKREASSEFAIIHINNQIRIQIPVMCLNSELLREIFELRIR
jgi:predicted transcriptional regulator